MLLYDEEIISTSCAGGNNLIQIPQNINIAGEIRCDGSIEVMCRVEGESDIKGLLVIGKDCVWIGKAVADTVIVEGFVEGSIIARKKIQIEPSAQIIGSITAPSILIAKSAKLNCEIFMDNNKQPIDLEDRRNNRPLAIPSLDFPQDSRHLG